jgi:hypothetical protein
MIQTCPECTRRFDLFDEVDAEEWYYGHDCEDLPETEKPVILTPASNYYY